LILRRGEKACPRINIGGKKRLALLGKSTGEDKETLVLQLLERKK